MKANDYFSVLLFALMMCVATVYLVHPEFVLPDLDTYYLHLTD